MRLHIPKWSHVILSLNRPYGIVWKEVTAAVVQIPNVLSATAVYFGNFRKKNRRQIFAAKGLEVVGQKFWLSSFFSLGDERDFGKTAAIGGPLGIYFL